MYLRVKIRPFREGVGTGGRGKAAGGNALPKRLFVALIVGIHIAVIVVPLGKLLCLGVQRSPEEWLWRPLSIQLRSLPSKVHSARRWAFDHIGGGKRVARNHTLRKSFKFFSRLVQVWYRDLCARRGRSDLAALVPAILVDDDGGDDDRSKHDLLQ